MQDSEKLKKDPVLKDLEINDKIWTVSEYILAYL